MLVNTLILPRSVELHRFYGRDVSPRQNPAIDCREETAAPQEREGDAGNPLAYDSAMPKVAIAESLSDWEGLVISASSASLDDSVLGENVEELRALLEQAKELHARRQRLEGERRATAQALAETTEQAKTVASRIRSKLKGVYGPNSSQLVRFGMKPRPLARTDAPPEPYSAVFKKEISEKE